MSRGDFTTTCRPVRSEEVAQALRLVLSTGPAGASDEQVVDFMRFALVRGIDTSAIWVAESGAQIHSAVLPIRSAGRTLLLLSSALNARIHSEKLVEQVLDEYARRGVHLVQVLLDPSEEGEIEFYARLGFERLAELIYLQGAVRRTARTAVELPAGWEWVTYSLETHVRFARAIAATYQGSKDCPALAGRREIEDIVAGHRATGEFDPSLWFLLSHGGEDLGVLLLAPSPPTEAMEVVYLGLVPGARGRKMGDVLLRQAFHATWAKGLGQVTLAVDAANGPALGLYYRHGMKRVHGKVAMGKELGGKLEIRGSQPSRSDQSETIRPKFETEDLGGRI